MPRALWTGSISFGLVTIPVRLLPAVRADEDVHFHYLHKKDQGRLHNVRKCEVCGEEVPWNQVVRGFEYAKGSYVVLSDDELDAIRAEVTPSVVIQAFVDQASVDPMLFDTPYYLEPEKAGRHAYALLRDVLLETGTVGIAQVALRTRGHLAMLRPVGRMLLVELLRYPHEVASAKDLEFPPANEKVTPAEKKAAKMLVDAMRKPFDPGDYKDEYEERLRAALEERAKHPAAKRAKGKPAEEKGAKVIDLAAVLARSLAERGGKTSTAKKGTAGARAPKKRAAKGAA